jgi:hypothetical protein
VVGTIFAKNLTYLCKKIVIVINIINFTTVNNCDSENKFEQQIVNYSRLFLISSRT